MKKEGVHEKWHAANAVVITGLYCLPNLQSIQKKTTWLLQIEHYSGGQPVCEREKVRIDKEKEDMYRDNGHLPTGAQYSLLPKSS